MALLRVPVLPPMDTGSFRALQRHPSPRCNLRSTSRINKSLPWWQIPPFTSSPINANLSLMGSLFCLFHLVQARSKQEKKPKEPPSIVHGVDSGILFPPVLLNPKSANFGVLNGPQNGWAASGSSHGQEASFSAHRQTCCAGKNSVNFRLSPLGLPDGPSDSNEQRARLVHTYKWRSQLRIHPQKRASEEAASAGLDAKGES